MSDDYITLVPRETEFIPLANDQDAAIEAFRKFAPEADDISIVQHDNIEFFDCGGNFEALKCPNCCSEIDMDWWGCKMSDDYISATNSVKRETFFSRVFNRNRDRHAKNTDDIKQGFQLRKYPLSCCQHTATLDELIYEWPQAFGRFGLTGLNCNIGQLSSEQVTTLQTLLKCKVVVVYQHL